MSFIPRSSRSLAHLPLAGPVASSSTSHLIHLRPLSTARLPSTPLSARQSNWSPRIIPRSTPPRGSVYCCRWNSSASNSAPSIAPPEPGTSSQRIGQIQPRLQMTFTCTANDCGHRSTHEFAKKSYEKGLVLIQCPECKARHLIADHIGWFKESTEDGSLKTVEDLLNAKGEKIKKGRVNMDGDIEYFDE